MNPSNRNYIHFDLATGRIQAVVNSPAYPDPLPAGVIEGLAHPDQHQIDLNTLQPVARPDYDPRPQVKLPNHQRVPLDDYRALRAGMYPCIEDQLDALWKALAGMPTLSPEAAAMLAAIQGVKQKYPKQ